MATKMCPVCSRSGKVMGGGMIYKDCTNCDGSGYLEEVGDDIELLQRKQTESYTKSRDKLIESHPALSNEQAEQMLDEELGKTKIKKKHKRGD